MAQQTEPLYHFLGTDMFPNRSFKVYRIQGAQSGEVLHSHDYMQIWYVAKGRCEHWVEGVKHVMVSGEAFVLPPEIPHKTVVEPDSEVIGCEFSLSNIFVDTKNKVLRSVNDSILDLSFMLLFFPEDAVRPKYIFSAESQIVVERVMQSILEEYDSGRLYSDEILQVEILHLLLLFAREYKTATEEGESRDIYRRHKEAVKSAISFIEENYSEKLTLEDVCKHSMISKTYFCYLFKMMTQQTFVEYLVNIRVNRAKQLLLDPDWSITQITHEVGFNDSSHFSRTFRKATGLSPREFRNRSHT